ncbi:hypothetical protein DCAR_0934468 [Daucus carota subsp. sativus]|uniref:Uncharacterized protein n=1 Tax=Daucus carota subsp. sativus TaxID=79200 RepID=A0A175YF99_DAUCS|nr:hypothetical protein DCAR_0934468 [Daucus carota subsp. sativus]
MGKVLENKKKVEVLGLKKLADGFNLKVIKEKVKDDGEHEYDVEPRTRSTIIASTQKIEKNILPEQLAPKGEIYEKTRKRDPKRKYKKIEKNILPEQLAPKGEIYEKTRKRDPKRKYKTITKEVMAEMDRKMCEKMKRIMEKLGDINPDFKNLDVEELWADDASEDDEEDNGVEENKSEEDDIGEEGDGHEDDNN